MDKKLVREISSRIKQLRKNSNTTQEKMAEIVGLTYNSYVKLENAYNAPSLKILIRLSEAFNVPIDMIVFGNVDRAKSNIKYRDRLACLISLADIEKLKHTDVFIQKIISFIEETEHDNQ